MKDKEKLWLEYRVCVDDYASEDIQEFLEKFAKNVTVDDSVMSIVIPVRKEESSVRLIYDPTGKHNKYILKLAKKYLELAIKELGAKKI